MYEVDRKRRRRVIPPLSELERSFDESLRADMEEQRRERLLRELMSSNERPEVLGAKAVIAGLINYYQYEEVYYFNEYKRRGGLAGLFLPKEEERTTKRVSRVVLER